MFVFADCGFQIARKNRDGSRQKTLEGGEGL